MQAGKERASLPLMRRFNEHSEKLLKASESKFSSCVFLLPLFTHPPLFFAPVERGCRTALQVN